LSDETSDISLSLGQINVLSFDDESIKNARILVIWCFRDFFMIVLVQKIENNHTKENLIVEYIGCSSCPFPNFKIS